MENFVLYLGKVSVLLTIFFLAYHLLLRKETFFNSNRWYLLGAILSSVLLPFILFQKIVLVEPSIRNLAPLSPTFVNYNVISPSEPAFELNWIHLLISIYSVGLLFFLLKFFKDLWSLSKVLRNQETQDFGNFKLLDTNKIQLPFSFFKYIVFNSNYFKKEELENILEHEKVHSSQYHSADMILSQLFCIVLWFNPFAWLHKKAIAQNLEFIADNQVLKNIPDRITYQKTLLKVSASHQCIPITNPFFQSLIKKRIVMLNKNQSKKRNSLKYLAVLPLLTLFMLQFQVETIAQEKPRTAQQDEPSRMEVVVDKNSSDAYLKNQSEALKKQGVTLKFSKIKRNSNNEIISIKTSYKDKKGNSADNYQQSDSPIQPFTIISSEDKVMIGSIKSSANQRLNETKTSQLRMADSSVPEMPTMPEMPVMPTMPNFGNIPVPVAPVMPTAPIAPSSPYNENNKDWKKFEEQMKKFENQMKSKEGEFAKFEKEMEKYGEQMEKAFTPELEKQIAEFEKKMEKFEAEMETYQEKMQSQNQN